MSDGYDTTKADFAYFKKRVTIWLKWIGLLKWNIHFDCAQIHDGEAETNIDVPGLTATFRLSSHIDGYDCFTKAQIDSAAEHEIWHLLIAKLQFLANERFGVTPELVEETVEEIVNQLTTLTIRGKKKSARR